MRYLTGPGTATLLRLQAMKFVWLLFIVAVVVAAEVDHAKMGEIFAGLYLKSYADREWIDLRWFERVSTDIYGEEPILRSECDGATPRHLFWKGVADRLAWHFEPPTFGVGPDIPHIPYDLGVPESE